MLYKEQQRECKSWQSESCSTWNQRRMAETLRQHIQQPNHILTQALKHGSQIFIVVVPMQIWTFCPTLHLHSCHPWVFPLKSCWITLSNLPPAAGKGRPECSPPASELVQVHTQVPSSRIWPLQIQKLEYGKTNDLWGDKVHMVGWTCIPEGAFWKGDAKDSSCFMQLTVKSSALSPELLEKRKREIWGEVKNKNQAGVTSVLNSRCCNTGLQWKHLQSLYNNL